ncbi:MAG: helix-turn-helix transcriptional regulator [Clostridia bacterium]|nr:helix-turn-helix transcriptional regulator [Clostridia bacterium]
MEYNTDVLRLREMRIKNGYSQEYIAFYLQTTRQQVSKWEKGTQMMGVDKYIKLAELYKVSVDYLLGRTDI